MTERKRRMPAEWEPQSMVQLTWPHKDTDWAPMLPEIIAVYEEMAREISKREDLLIVAPEDILPNLSPLTSHLSPLKSFWTSASTAGARSSQPTWIMPSIVIFTTKGWLKAHTRTIWTSYWKAALLRAMAREQSLRPHAA